MKKQHGFTLVELLIVIIIIGILAMMAVPQYQKMVDKAKIAEAKSNLNAIANAIYLYHVEHGHYSAATGGSDGVTTIPPELDIDISSSNPWEYCTCGGGNQAVAYANPMSKVFLGFLNGLEVDVYPDRKEYRIRTNGANPDYISEWNPHGSEPGYSQWPL